MRRGREIDGSGFHGSSPLRRSGTPGGRISATASAPCQSGLSLTNSRIALPGTYPVPAVFGQRATTPVGARTLREDVGFPPMGKLGGEASTELDASIEEVWDVVVDIETAPEWQDGFEKVDVLERDDEGRVLVAETESDAKVKTVKNRLRFSYEEPNLVEWRQEKGDLKSLVGAWELEDLGDGRTKATYRLEGDPRRLLRQHDRGPGAGQMRKHPLGG